jgi:hypothetical protein
MLGRNNLPAYKFVGEDLEEEELGTVAQHNANMLAKYNPKPKYIPSNNDLLVRLKKLGSIGSVDGIRQLIKFFKVTTPPRDLNKMVKLTGYKFITRQGQLFFIKDTQFFKQAELDSKDNSAWGSSEDNNLQESLEDRSNLQQEIDWLRAAVKHLIRLLQEFGFAQEEIEEELENVSTSYVDAIQEMDPSTPYKYGPMDADKEDVAEEMPYYSKSKVLGPKQYNLYEEEHNKDTSPYSKSKVLQPRQYNLLEEEYNRDINPNYSNSRGLRPRQYNLFEVEDNRDTKPYYAKVQDVKNEQKQPRQQEKIDMGNVRGPLLISRPFCLFYAQITSTSALQHQFSQKS